MIDDEPTVREVVADILDSNEVSVLKASDGEEGLETFISRRHEIRLVLLDLTMPGISGEDVCRQIRVLAPDLPVVITSGYTESEAGSRYPSLEATAFLKKPYQWDELMAMVRRYMT